MAAILITGGTGLVGRVLSRYLVANGHTCIIMTRNPANWPALKGIRYAAWDPARGSYDTAAFEQADYVVNLAGAGVADKRWTAARKIEIRDSRVQSGELLVNALGTVSHQVKAVISASAIGYYGPDPEVPNTRPFAENDPPASGFLGDTCRDWETSIQPLTTMGIRTVVFRIGIVLSRHGGALKEFLKPLRAGIAAILGNGKQVVSWIHIDDLVRMIDFAMEQDTLSGTFNAVAPAPVNNYQLTGSLAKLTNKFYIPVRVPAPVLKIMLGEMSIEVLKSATVSAAKIKATGFQFLYKDIRSALEAEIQAIAASSRKSP